MFHTTLSKGKHVAQKEKESILLNPRKRDRKYCKPGSKDRVLTIYMYTNQPRSIDRVYNLKNQSHKTGNNISI